MMDGGAAAFLQQAHRNNWQQYLASLLPTARRGWDVCILTAGDERQAAIYRRQLDWRREAGLLPARTQFLVLPDPADRRIGSGGATLRALLRVQGSRWKEAPTHDLPSSTFNLEPSTFNRLLIIHAGGDARRLPHCSAIGKLFARVPRELPDGRASTIFDEFLIGLSGLAADLPAGVLVASGDVLLIFDQLQLRGAFRRSGVIGVAATAPATMAAHHGVYVSGGNGPYAVRAYLHKPEAADLARWQAVDADGTVQIDTGLVWFDSLTAAKLGRLAGDLAEEVAGSKLKVEVDTFNLQPVNLEPAVPLNLYGDLLLPLAASTTLESYLAGAGDGPASPALQAARQVIWERLRGTSFTVERVQPAVFEHFGTSLEYWRMVAGNPDLARLCGWGLGATSEHGLALINAVAPPAPQDWGEHPMAAPRDREEHPVTAPRGRGVGGATALVVDSRLSGLLTWQGVALVANVETAQSLALGADLVLHQLPVAGGYVTRIYGLHDDPKRGLDDLAATFLNRPWADWLAGDEVLAAALWGDGLSEPRTLWNARLYPLLPDREAGLALALSLQDPAHAPDGWRADWLAAPRLSLAESFRQADGERILAEAAVIEDHVAAQGFYRAIVAEEPASRARTRLGRTPGAIARRAELVSGWLAAADPLLQIRGNAALAEATGNEAWEDRAFGTLAALVEGSRLVPGSRLKVPGSHLLPSTFDFHPVRVSAAARIDFGGGWTDTPPYSIERGGTVLNAAVTLRGRHPIIAEVESLAEPRLILDSRDIGAALTPAAAGEVLDYANPADPFALLKAALVLRGIIPQDADPASPVSELLGRLACGLRLSTQTFIPRGSGLGTSSIMAGAVLAALARWAGAELPPAQLFDEVLCLEQMLTTGGGWQDQVGGLTGGIKLVTTGPGLPQAIHVEPARLARGVADELAARLLLVYTGQQRLAKNLLRHVMRRWMIRDPEMVWIQGELARLALVMRDALAGGDLDTFGSLLGEHWQLNKRMDPGCTNPFIDELFDMMASYINGGKLAGAGGGGYAMVVARSPDHAHALTADLQARYPGTPVEVWPCGIPEAGLHVDTLQVAR